MSSETPNSGHAKPPIPTPAKKVPAWNIEKRNDRLYEVTTLHKWFAISSLLFFVFTVIMIMADYSREWKRYQREFTRISIERAQQDVSKAAGSLDRNKLKQLQVSLAEAQKSQAQNSAVIKTVQKKLDDLNATFVRIDTDYKNSKASYGTEKYDLDEAVAAAKIDPKKQPEADRAAKKLADRDKEMSGLFAQRESLSTQITDTKAELEKYVGKGEEARKGIEDGLANYNRLKTQLNALDPGFLVTSIRNAPVMDMLNASEKVQQILLSNLYNDQPFKQISRVDRCITCHQGIDNPKNANLPIPYKTHPNLKLYLASASSHPIENFGCTSCHGGLDRSTGFQDAGHTPRNEKQKEEWVKKYGWHTDEFQIAAGTPMMALDRVESGCYKCHNSSPDVTQAPAIDNGRDLIRIYGCFGCHKIPGYDGVRKVGPDLSTVSGKLTKEWIRKWLADPKAFKSEARMPRFWNNSNNSGIVNGTDWDKRSAAEINAITDFIWSKSKPKVLPAANPSGNAAHGKELVESVGCFGCHAVGSIETSPTQSQTRRRHGFNLAAEGGKVDASWIYNWVKDPKAVWQETKMPSLRLSDSEAADITAYLSSLKNEAWTAKPLPAVDGAALDSIILELLRANSTDAEARAKLKTMSLEDKNLMAGERLVRRYGCFGCHNIPGMEKEQPIGTELTEAGSKLVSQLDFGFMRIEHDRASWYTQKLTDPRSFDVNRVKTPEELLKMPNFTFSPQDVQSITMVLTSMVKDKVQQEMREQLPAAVIAGRQLIDEKNCKGCHIIEKMGGDIRGFLRGATNQLQWPPNLNTEGFKTQPMWLAKFIKDPGAIKLRMFMNTRMPTFHFTEKEVSTLTAYFSAVDKVDYPFISTVVDTTPDKLKVGGQLFETLKCMSCHPTGNTIPPGKKPEEMAPNLLLAQGRLRPDWVLEWIKDPQTIAPGVSMPSFFSNYPKSDFKDFYDGDAKAQIQAIRDHLFVTVGGGQKSVTAGN
jgi:cytochrome c2/uncharacterized protein YlxW (UPF0749 family)